MNEHMLQEDFSVGECDGQRELSVPLPWSWRTMLRYALVTLALMLVGAIIWASRSALTPCIIGLVLAYILLPLVGRLDRHMPRWASIVVVYVIGISGLAAGCALIVPPATAQINEVVQSAPTFYADARQKVDQGITWLNTAAPAEVRQQIATQVDKVQQAVQENANHYVQNVAQLVFSGVLGIFQTLTFLLGFLIIPFFLFYVLIDTPRLRNTIDQLLHPRLRADWWNIVEMIDIVLGKYIRGQLLLGAVVGACSFGGLLALRLLGFHVQFPVLLAIVAGLGELIPVVGPVLTAIPAILVGFTQSPQTALAVVALYVVIQQIENQVLVPRIVGTALRVRPALLMVALVIAAQLGGLLLVILVAPLVAIARDLFLYLHRRLQEPAMSPGAARDAVMELGKPS